MAPIFVVDTNCMVAAICTWHEHHRPAIAEIERRLDLGERLAVPAPALVEAYAVLTRLPAPHRISPAEAWNLLAVNFVQQRRIVALRDVAYVATLGRLAKEGASGGHAYDAIIAECAREAKASTLLTFDRRHFEPPPQGISVVEPCA